MVSVAFHRLVLKHNFILERRASFYKRCADVVNRILHHLFFSFSPVLLSFLWLFLEPSSISVSLGNYGCWNWMCFSKHDYICFTYRVRDVLEGAEEGGFQQLPHGPHCTPEGSKATSAPPFQLFLLVTPVQPFLYISIFLSTFRGYCSPFTTALGI